MPAEPPVDDRLRQLEERLSRASAAAERLAREAGQRLTGGVATGTSGPPPAGWQAPAGPGAGEPDPVDTLIHTLRGLLPPDLQQRLFDALRELLLAARALIDWALERFEERRRTPVEVEDIPID